MSTIERTIASITEDRRAGYLWSTKLAADATGMHPNKFNQRWNRTKEFLIALAATQPGETAAELAAVLAQGLAERSRADSSRADRNRADRRSGRDGPG